MAPLTDAQIVGLTSRGEARGEPLEGIFAVAWVIRNRKQSGRWGQTYELVCRAPKQFSCWNADDPNFPMQQSLADGLEAGVPTSDPDLVKCLWVAEGVLDGFHTSPVQDATHYYATSLKVAPVWASTGTFVTRIGSQMFFRGVL